MSARLYDKTVGEIRALARVDAKAVLEKEWPYGTLPVDPVVIARKLGISVYKAQLGDDVWGMLVSEDGDTSIYLDEDQHHFRYRFTCAHEVGHYIDRRDELLDGGAIIDYRDKRGQGTADEIYANEFGASLLMPEEEFRRHVERGASDFDLRDWFGVSLDAVALRRRHLELVQTEAGKRMQRSGRGGCDDRAAL